MHRHLRHHDSFGLAILLISCDILDLEVLSLVDRSVETSTSNVLC